MPTFFHISRRRRCYSAAGPAAALAALLLAATSAQGALVYFIVAERFPAQHGDSYVLPLSDPADIQHARDLASFNPNVGQRIVLARIGKGADGVNRDYTKPGAPLWNWHVTEFLGFADFTAEIYDGWPTYVEQDVDGWIANTGGVVGFWSYTVFAEATWIPEVPSAWLAAAAAAPVAAWFVRRARNTAERRHRYRLEVPAPYSRFSRASSNRNGSTSGTTLTPVVAFQGAAAPTS